jgi:hypothetical protein
MRHYLCDIATLFLAQGCSLFLTMLAIDSLVQLWEGAQQDCLMGIIESVVVIAVIGAALLVRQERLYIRQPRNMID